MKELDDAIKELGSLLACELEDWVRHSIEKTLNALWVAKGQVGSRTTAATLQAQSAFRERARAETAEQKVNALHHVLRGVECCPNCVTCQKNAKSAIDFL